jgi:hypothetical protein
MMKLIDKFFDTLEKYSDHIETFFCFYINYHLNVFFLFWSDSSHEKYITGKVHNLRSYDKSFFRERGRCNVYVEFSDKTFYTIEYFRASLKKDAKPCYDINYIRFLYNVVHFLLKDYFLYRFFFKFVIKTWFKSIVRARYGIFSFLPDPNFNLPLGVKSESKLLVLDIFWVVLLNTYISYFDRLYIKVSTAESYLKHIMDSGDVYQINKLFHHVWPWWKFWYYISRFQAGGDLNVLYNSHKLTRFVLYDLTIKYVNRMLIHERKILDFKNKFGIKIN